MQERKRGHACLWYFHRILQFIVGWDIKGQLVQLLILCFHWPNSPWTLYILESLRYILLPKVFPTSESSIFSSPLSEHWFLKSTQCCPGIDKDDFIKQIYGGTGVFRVLYFCKKIFKTLEPIPDGISGSIIN